MPRKRRWCTVHVNQHGYLFFRLYLEREWKEGLDLQDTPENRRRAEQSAIRIAKAMEAGKFHYLRFFPRGNRVQEFQRREQPRHETRLTVATYFDRWEKTLAAPKVRKATAGQYRSLIKRHILPTLGTRPISTLTWEDLAMLQDQLRSEGVGVPTINRALHSAFRALIRDARRNREVVARDLFDRALWRRLDEDSGDEPDPYDVEERRLILDHFQGSHWYPLAYFLFFQGARPSEAVALRRRDVDLHHGVVYIRRSRVQSDEGKTKTKKSRRTVRLHPDTITVLRDAWPIDAEPDDYVFTTPTGAPVDQANFQKRQWRPMLRCLGLRERPLYNTRHSYISYLLSIGKRPSFVAEQTGHSIRTMERFYAKDLPRDDDVLLPSEGESATGTPTAQGAKTGRNRKVQ